MRKLSSNVAWGVALFVCLLVPAGFHAADVDAQGAAVPANEPRPIKVELTMTRSQGARKLSSAPFVLVVNAIPATPNSSSPRQGNALSASLRAGVSTWTGRNISSNDNGKVSTVPEYQYVGTDIDCQADYREAGIYRVYLSLADSSLMQTSGPELGTSTSIANIAALGVRRFNASNTLLIRDGQTVQFSVGTDPITGDTVRVEVTVTTLK